MNRNALLAIVAACLSATVTITVPSLAAIHSRTARETACVQSGGDFVHAPDTSKMECHH